MSLRVVLLAEGAGELGSAGLPPAPGTPIEPDEFGPAHVLVQRILMADRGLAEGAIRFEVPLRRGARLARGSDLHSRTTVRQLLAYPRTEVKPQLAIVLVDEDGKPDRLDETKDWVRDLRLPSVVAVAVREFEAWLLADPRALRDVLGSEARMDNSPETLEPREAKQQLTAWCGALAEDRRAEDVRLSLARSLDLDVASRRCQSLARFRSDIASLQFD